MNGGAVPLPWRSGGGRQGDACVIVRFRLTPNSSKDTIDGLETTAEGPAFKARVRAVPENGKANAALERLVAAWLDVPKSAVQLSGGHKSRVKSVTIGVNAAHILELLEAKFRGAGGAESRETRKQWEERRR